MLGKDLRLRAPLLARWMETKADADASFPSKEFLYGSILKTLKKLNKQLHFFPEILDVLSSFSSE